MIEQTSSTASLIRPPTGPTYLCLYGHFYQPPREDPFTRTIPREPYTTPYANMNEKITVECYFPNAVAGNFQFINFDLGPTLASWLEQQHPDIYRQIIAADQQYRSRYDVGNALAQAYNHTILPLADCRDKRTQIAWGLADFRHRFSSDAHGMWLAETAIDLESLDLLAQSGVTYTVLAPWQATTPVNTLEPYVVRLPHGRSITVFFYNAPLSGGVSFDWHVTSNADLFAASYLPGYVDKSKQEAGEAQLILIATDGELYGHHKPWRDKFLSHLIHVSAPSSGFEVSTLEHYILMHPAQKEAQLRLPSAWSCGHGVARWDQGCECTEGDSHWKGALRCALNTLADHGNRLFEQYAGETLNDPWAARDGYLALYNGWEPEEHFWQHYGKQQRRPESVQLAQRTLLLLEAQYYQQYSFTSCGFFFEDLDRIEPRNNIAFARRAISLTWKALGIDLQRDFLHDLAAVKSWRKNITGADIYRQLPSVKLGMLPPLLGELSTGKVNCGDRIVT